MHGSGLVQAATGALRGNRSLRDVVRVVWGVLLPGRHLGDLTDRHAVTGVPRALWRRATTAVRTIWSMLAQRRSR